MAQSSTPTWELVLGAAQRLMAAAGEFRLQDLVAEVQRADPARGRGTIQPTVQGMTVNAGTGPPSPCGKPLLRTGRGWYTLADIGIQPVTAHHKNEPSTARRPLAVTGHGRASRDAQVADRLDGVIATFVDCLTAYDRLVPFNRVGQYETHRAAIDRRRHLVNVSNALADDNFLGLLYQTLRRWGIGIRASRLAPLDEFRRLLRAQSARISALDSARIDDPSIEAAGIADEVWDIIQSLGIVANNSIIVPGTKTMHHLLPDLVPPMDRAWTGAFFLWSAAAPQYAQAATFRRTFTGFAHIAQATHPANHVGNGWRTSVTKVLDNAVIGYCRINNIGPAAT